MSGRAGPAEPLLAIPPRRPDAAAPAVPTPEPKPLAPAGVAEAMFADPPPGDDGTAEALRRFQRDMVPSDTLPPGALEFRDPADGSRLGAIVNLAPVGAAEEMVFDPWEPEWWWP